MEAPERIYLQTGFTEWDEDEPWPTDGVTWCVDQIHDSDVEYVRRDVAVKLREELCGYWKSAGWAEATGDLLDETAWLADSPEAVLSPDGETTEESET